MAKLRKITHNYDSIKIGNVHVFETDYGGCCGIHEVRGFQASPEFGWSDDDEDNREWVYDTDGIDDVCEVFSRSSEVPWPVNQIFLGLVTSWKYVDRYQAALAKGGWVCLGEPFKNPNTGNMIEMWTYTVAKDKQK